MRRRIWTIAAGVAALAAVIVVPAAMAATYSSAKLTVTQAGTLTTIKASLDPNDDATASVRILAPAGTQVTTTQAPGTTLGPVKAIVKALDLAGADLPLEGQLVVAAPGQVPAHRRRPCLQTTAPTATWVMVLSAAGQTLQVPTYLDRSRRRPGLHPDLPAAARTCPPGRRAARPSARRCTAPSSRSTASSAPPRAGHGSALDAVQPGSRVGERGGHDRDPGRDRARAR